MKRRQYPKKRHLLIISLVILIFNPQPLTMMINKKNLKLLKNFQNI